jgi:DNA-binding response OmpR family regulator
LAHKILVVEDDETLSETLAYSLGRQGYEVVVSREGHDALAQARAAQPDLIVLDVMLPGVDGFEICRVLRQEMNVPILMLTAKDDEVDKVVGLEVGADDYLTKPFSMRELQARIKAHLRRVRLLREEYGTDQPDPLPSVNVTGSRFAFGNLIIDQQRREVLLEGQALHLKPKEYELLEFLAQNRRIALSRDLILERVWGWDFSGGSRTVDVHVRWLREKIEENPAEPTRIVTVRGTGYRFEG